MEHHPLTPMTDADIRRWLSRQARGTVGHVPHEAVRRGPGAIAAALDGEAAAGRRFAVVDAVADDDLRAIGRAAAAHRLLVGGSGLAIGLPDNFRAAGRLGASRAQLARHLAERPGLAVESDAVEPDAVQSGALTVQRNRPILAISRLSKQSSKRTFDVSTMRMPECLLR